MAIPVAPFPCPLCGYVVVYSRRAVEDGVDFAIHCLAVSCEYKEGAHVDDPTVPDRRTLEVVGAKYRAGIC